MMYIDLGFFKLALGFTYFLFTRHVPDHSSMYMKKHIPPFDIKPTAPIK